MQFVLIIVAGIGSYLVWPEFFTPRNIAETMNKFQGEALLIYFAVSVFRGLTLLPSTPLVIAGTLLFPEQAWLVLAVSIVGILVSSAMIYRTCSGLANSSKRESPNTLRKYVRGLSTRRAFSL